MSQNEEPRIEGYDPSLLLQEIEGESVDWVDKEWDYGYGGESYEVYRVDPNKIEQFILARERRYLSGMTLEEYAREVGEHGL